MMQSILHSYLNIPASPSIPGGVGGIINFLSIL